MRFVTGVFGSMVILAPIAALAQTPIARQLPTGQSPLPEPAAATPGEEPTSPVVVDEAKVGGGPTYGRAGVRELGAAAGLSIAQDIRAVNFSPSFGWFVNDNFELSAVLDVTNLKAGSASATMWSALAEPSFHFPINNSVFGFFGMGLGVAFVNELGAALAVAPELGLDVMVGKTGILRPSLSYQYTTHDAMGTVDDQGVTDVTLVAISSALRFNIGYSRMW
jgi:hypothetical protein